MIPKFDGLANFMIVGMVAIVLCVGYGGYVGIRAIFFPKEDR